MQPKKIKSLFKSIYYDVTFFFYLNERRFSADYFY
jgi:hypothetical protein